MILIYYCQINYINDSVKLFGETKKEKFQCYNKFETKITKVVFLMKMMSQFNKFCYIPG